VAARNLRRPSQFPSLKSAGLLRYLTVAALLLATLVVGCKKKPQPTPLKPAQVHAITREMLRSASAAVHEQGSVESRLEFDGVHPEHSDHLRITLSAKNSEPSRSEAAARIIQSLDRTATSNALTRDPASTSGVPLHLSYRRLGVLTHSIEIIVRNSPATRFPQQTGAARLAIILDDLGNDRVVAEEIFALSYPLTISVLPEHPHSREIAEEARRRGYQVMLHLPMQSVANQKPEARELHPGMSRDDVAALVNHSLQSVPDVVGVNNHQGSQSTADTALMNALMPVLRAHQLFYVDSRTTAATVAFDTAQRLGVPSGFRTVPFLDDVAEPSAVRKQLQLALRGAKNKGAAIAIGHPHPATLQALREILPQANAQGVRLVFASELVH